MAQQRPTFVPGDLVEVKTAKEILMTLDAEGAADHLPFMPEMVEFCGQRFRVSRRAGRLCYSGPQSGRAMREFKTDDVVLLDDVRCSGAAHDGCQKACMIFWREAWLRKSTPAAPSPVSPPGAREALLGHLRTSSGPRTYFCQASELFNATNVVTRPEVIGRCVRDVRDGRCGVLDMTRRVGTWLFWKVRRKLLGEYARGPHQAATPTATLGLKPGDWVIVKPLDDIMETLSPTGYNRGLYFSPDMRLACGKRFRVKERIDRIIDDGTGRMRDLHNTVRLEGSLCNCSYVSLGGCTRVDIVYWREIWLERVGSPAEGTARVPEREALSIGSSNR